MERYLYNRLIHTALDAAKEKRSFSDDIIGRLQLVNSLNQGVNIQPLDLQGVTTNQSLTVQEILLDTYSDINTNLGPATPLLPINVSSMQTLFDDTYVVQHSQGLTHYTKTFDVIQVFPFTYVNVTTVDEYYPTGKVNILNLADISYIFIPNNDFIQMYSYDGLTFIFVGTIGSTSSSGTGAGLLLDVKCITTKLLDTGDIRVFVSGGAGITSYVKQINIQLDSTPLSEEIVLSYTVGNQGLMTLNGVYDVKALASDIDFLYISSIATKQLGVFNLASKVFEIVYEDKIKDIGNNDFLITPNDIEMTSDGSLLCGDSRGHIFIIQSDLSIGDYHGQPQETVYSTSYPFSFSSITSVSLSSTTPLFISQGRIYTSNIRNRVTNTEISIVVVSPAVDSKIQNIYGVCDPTITIGGKVLNICDSKNYIIPASSSITITSKLNETSCCSEGLIVFELC